MKVTTQRTSKPIKLITAGGAIAALVGLAALVSGAEWALVPLLLGALLWALGRVLAWFFHE